MSVEQLAQVRFNQNLEYFKQIDTHFSQEAVKFQNALASRFELMYEEKENYFYLKDQNGNILSKNDFEINFDEKFYFKNEYEYIEVDEISFHSSKFSKLVELREKFYKREFEEPFKLMVSGVKNLEELNAYLNYPTIEEILIFEPELELFYLSLYVIDWYKIAQTKKLFFSFFDNQGLHQKALEFFKSQPYLLYRTYVLPANKHYADLVHQKLLPIFSQNYGLIYIHKMGIFKNTIDNIYAKVPYLGLYDQIATDVPVLLLSSGPSLDLELEWIKANQSKFLVCCVGSSLKKLLKNAIKPDIVFSVDAKVRIIEQFRGIDEAVLKDIIFIASDQSDPGILNLFRQTYMVTTQGDATVNHFGLNILIRLGFKLLFTLGNDAAYLDNKEEYAADVVKPSVTSTSKTAKIQVPSNRGGRVWTSESFLKYISNYSMMFAKHPEITIYNLSSGAYIEGFTPLETVNITDDILPEIDLQKKEDLLHILRQSKYIADYFPHCDDLVLGIKKVIKKFKKFKNKDLTTIKTTEAYQKFRYSFFEDSITILNYNVFTELIDNFYKETDFVVYALEPQKELKQSLEAYHILWLEILEELLSEFESITKSLKSAHIPNSFIKKYIDILYREVFTLQAFNNIPKGHQLSSFERHMLYEIEKLYIKNEGNQSLENEAKLFYIAALRGEFEAKLAHYLSGFSTIDNAIVRLYNVFKVITTAENFELSLEEYSVIVNFYTQVFDENVFFELPQEHQFKFIDSYYGFYIHKRIKLFEKNLPLLNRIFQRYLEQKLDLQALIAIYDNITFMYWGTMVEMSHIKTCDDAIIKPFSNYLLNYFKEHKVPQRNTLSNSNRKKKRVCYLANITSYEGAYAVGKAMYSIFKGHYELNSGDFEFYYYAYNRVDEVFLKEIESFGFQVRRFDKLANSIEKINAIRQACFDDEIDIAISEMPWGIATTLFESRIAPIQMYISWGWHYWSLKNLERFIIPQGHTTNIARFSLVAKNIYFKLDKRFLKKVFSQKEILNERAKYPKDKIILGATQRLVKITDAYLEALKTILVHNDDAVMILAGNGDRSKIETFIQKNHLEARFFLPGYVDSFLYTYIYDIYVNTFDFPGGNSVVEAMANNTVVVTLLNNNWDNNEIMGMCVNTEKEFMQTVDKLINDRNYYQEEKEKAKEVYEWFSDVKTPAKELEDNFKDLILS
jgi:hypothetical protein